VTELYRHQAGELSPWVEVYIIDEDLLQLIEDAKLLAYLEKHLGRRDFNDMIGMAEEREEMGDDD
jgi:hypothetical protein